MSPSVHVGRLRQRLRAPARLADDAARVGRTLEEAARSLLPVALARAGVGTTEHVCVRRLHTIMRLPVDRPELSLAIGWAEAVRVELERLLREGSSEIVRYRTRRRALVDLVVRTIDGDRRRAWAWRQLGLVRFSGPTWPIDQVPPQLLAAIEAEPAAIVPLLVELGRRGRLGRLFAVLPAASPVSLASAALGAHGATRTEVMYLLAAPSPTPRGASGKRGRLTARLGPFEAALAGLARARGDVARALAVLGVLAEEPAALQRGPEGFLVRVGVLERRLSPEPRDEEWAGPRATASVVAPSVRIAEARDAPAPSAAGRSEEREGRSASRRPDDAREGRPIDAPQPSARAPGRDVLRPGAPASAPDADVAEEHDDVSVPTRWGGLLYFVHLVARLELPERILDAPALAGRPLVASLHRLAEHLLPIAEDDAARLAFVGLAPDDAPPSTWSAAFTAEEDDVLRALAAELTRELARLLQRDDGRAALIEAAHRAARIVWDPGWIEVHIAIDDVSTELRRIGLDLDPGWVSWLGVVLRFVYA